MAQTPSIPHLKPFFAAIFFFILNCNATAQDSSRLQISLLTCTPGQELYSTFGHSALRIVDSSQHTDRVYNYGTFYFDDDFYFNFMKGKLNYFLSVDETADFISQYQYEQRGITEQVLNFSAPEKKSLLSFVNENSKNENRFYKYDFFFDNCTTRLRDVLQKQKDTSLQFPAVMPAGTTFRNAIHKYLNEGNMHWSKLGIDILLGYPCDAVMKGNQDGFLPYNLLASLDSNSKQTHLVLSEKDLYKPAPGNDGKTLFTPFVIFCMAAAFIMLLGFIKNWFAVTFHFIFGFLFYLALGLLGILLIIMWTATDHAMCRNNFNLLWAWPTHAVFAFFYASKKSRVKNYFGANALFMLVLLVCWFFIPQKLNVALIPITILQFYYSMRKYFGK